MLFKEGELKERLELLLESIGRRKQTAAARERIQTDLDKLEAGMELDSLDKYFPLTGKFTTLLDYFPPETPVFLSEYADLKETIRAQWASTRRTSKSSLRKGSSAKGWTAFS